MAFRPVYTDLLEDKRKAIFLDIVKDVIKSFADGIEKSTRDEAILPKSRLRMAVILSGIKNDWDVLEKILNREETPEKITLNELQKLLEEYGEGVEFIPRDRVIPLKRSDYGGFEDEQITMFSVGTNKVTLSLKEWVEEVDQTCVLKEMSSGDKFFAMSQ